MVKEKIILDFVLKNIESLKEALENHCEEVQSLMESADDDEYTELNKKRNKLLRKLKNIL